MGAQYRTSSKGEEAVDVMIDYSGVRSLGLKTYTKSVLFVVFGFFLETLVILRN